MFSVQFCARFVQFIVSYVHVVYNVQPRRVLSVHGFAHALTSTVPSESSLRVGLWIVSIEL